MNVYMSVFFFVMPVLTYPQQGILENHRRPFDLGDNAGISNQSTLTIVVTLPIVSQ